MKTPEEIKKGLECCVSKWVANHWKTCDNKCPYVGMLESCRGQLTYDSLALIEQLEGRCLNRRRRDNVRLIDADALMSGFDVRKVTEYDESGCGVDYKAVPVEAIENAPTIDAEPVRHGRWIDEIEPNAITASGREVHVFRCSACDFTWANKTAVLHYFRHCPNCGSKMDGDSND